MLHLNPNSFNVSAISVDSGCIIDFLDDDEYGRVCYGATVCFEDGSSWTTEVSVLPDGNVWISDLSDDVDTLEMWDGSRLTSYLEHCFFEYVHNNDISYNAYKSHVEAN